MRKLLCCTVLLIALLCCTEKETDSGPSSSPSSSCTYNGHVLHRGSQSGCYYYNSNGNKVYVDRSYCNCI